MQNVVAAMRPSGSHGAPFRVFLLLCLGMMILMLSGCSKQDLYSNLTEEHANEMVAVLSEAGIDSEKIAAEEGLWTINVDQGQFAKAVDLLSARGLPREKFETLGTVFKEGKFGENGITQQARLAFALSQELEQSIREIDGIVSARVHLAIPEPKTLTTDRKPTSASVLVKYRTGFDIRSKKSEIQTLVANGVEGLAFDDVSVIITPARSIQTATRQDSGISFGFIGRVFLALIALTLVGLAVRAMLQQRRKHAVQTAPSENDVLID